MDSLVKGFIQVRVVDGHELRLVSLSHIISVSKNWRGGSFIQCTEGTSFSVLDSYDEVIKKMEEAACAAS